MNWTQPICDNCWFLRNPDREPFRIRAEYAEVETCAFCGQRTRSGIYIRIHPDTVPFPKEEA